MFPRPIFLGETASRGLVLSNHSELDVCFEFESECELRVIPHRGSLPRASSMEIAVEIATSQLVNQGMKELDTFISCRFNNGEFLRSVRVCASIRHSVITVNPSVIDFGVVALGSTCRKQIVLTNESAVPAAWEFSGFTEVVIFGEILFFETLVICCDNWNRHSGRVWQENQEQETPEIDLVYSHTSGAIPAFGKEAVDITYSPSKTGPWNSVLVIKDAGGQQLDVLVKRRAISPCLRLSQVLPPPSPPFSFLFFSRRTYI